MLCLWNNLAKHHKICQIFRIRKPTYVLYKVFWLFSSEVFRNVEIWPYCLLIFIKKIQVFLKQNFVICIRFYKKHFFKEKTSESALLWHNQYFIGYRVYYCIPFTIKTVNFIKFTLLQKIIKLFNFLNYYYHKYLVMGR